MIRQLTRRRFTVSEYHRMGKAGILTEDDRVELLDGELFEMPPIGPAHAACVNRLDRLFNRSFGDAALVSVQNPVRLSEYTEPQPDLVLLRPHPNFYAAGHPTPEDVFLLVEVAATSAALDRQVKMPLYARSGILEFWLVDLEQETITVYREPTTGGYHTSWTVRRGELLAALAFPDQELAATDILGGS